MKTRLVSIVVLLLAGGPLVGQEAAGPATAPATAPTALDQIKSEQRQTVERQHEGRPTLGPVSIDQVVRIDVENGRFAIDTSLEPTNGEHRVLVEEDPGLWWVVVNHRQGGAPMYMVVQRYDFSNPDNVFTHAMVTASTSQVSISGAVEDAHGMVQVELLDRSALLTPDEGLVDQGGMRLFVSGYDRDGMRTLNVRVEAPDLPALRDAHADVVNAYLRSVLRDLGQEHVLAVDPALAWQVLGGERPAAAEVMRQVEALLPKLDDDAFAERERAAAALRALGEAGAIAMQHVDRAKLSPEQNARIDELLAEHQQVSRQEASALARDVDFLLDVLLSEDPQLRKLALARLTEQMNQPIAFDVEGSTGERAKRVAVLRQALRRGASTLPDD